MIEQITLLLATPIAKSILDKFYDGIGSKLGETLVEKAPDKIKQLGQLIWEKCLCEWTGSLELLESASKGSQEDQTKLTQYLHGVLDANTSLKNESQKLAEEIHQFIQFDDVNARNVQQVFDGQGLQVNDPKSQVIQAGDNAKFYFGVQSED